MTKSTFSPASWAPRAKLALSLTGAAVLAHLVLGSAVAYAQAPSAGPSLVFTPQGSVRNQTRMEAMFSSSMVAAGAQGPSPVTTLCSVKGTGRWETDKRWAYQLERPLATGERCTFSPTKGLKDLTGAVVRTEAWYTVEGSQFSLDLTQPLYVNAIQSDQVFVFTGSASFDSKELDSKAWCQSSVSPEKIPLVLRPDALTALLAAGTVTRQTAPLQMFAASCKQTLVEGTKLSVVFDAGLKARSGDALPLRRTFDFKVAEPFKATVTCSRPKPQAPCDPFSAVTLQFNHQLPKELAERITLSVGDKVLKPQLGLDYADGGDSGYVRDDASVTSASFSAAFPENAKLTLSLPAGMHSTEGQVLVNQGKFPMQVPTGLRGALGKFSGDFGILELNEGGVLPLTVRRLEKKLALSALSMKSGVSETVATKDEDVIRLIGQLRKFNATRDASDPAGSDNRARSFFKDSRGPVKTTALPAADTMGEMEVLGIPLTTPGFHVVELSSQLLGKALLDKAAPMYVRTSALVTNMAVHLKRGTDSSLVWVTQLDSGAPVADATVSIRDCKAGVLWSGKTDADGLAQVRKALTATAACPDGFSETFISARKGSDFSFALDSWGAGLETWRFGVTQASDQAPGSEEGGDYGYGDPLQARLNSHTIFDRTLFKRGETLSMKHLLRWQSEQGLSRPPKNMLFTEVVIRHLGGSDKYQLPLTFDKFGEASSTWPVPATAKLGTYSVSLVGGAAGERDMGMFRVSDFKLPAFTGQLSAERGKTAQDVLIKSNLSFLDAGPAKGQVVSYTVVAMSDWEHFEAPKAFSGYRFRSGASKAAEPGAELQACESDKVLIDGAKRTLDAKGQDVFVPKLPRFATNCTVRVEMQFFDPSGQTSSMQSSHTVFPSSYLVGLKSREVPVKPAPGSDKGAPGAPTPTTTQLDFATVNIVGGKPVAGVKLKVHATQSVVYSHRRKVVGGFYAYSSETVVEDRGDVCAGATDAKGQLSCAMPFKLKGNITLNVEAETAQGEKQAPSFESWAGPREGAAWENPSNDDRMSLAPDKAQYKVGDVAHLTASLPFQSSWALVTVEREGVLSARVQQLTRDKSTVDIPLEARHAPNVYAGVLAVRGRVASDAKGDPVAPTALLDLGKPAFRAALAELQVDFGQNALKLKLELAKPAYKPRETVDLKITATQADGTPAKDARVTLAVVDAALLELSPNDSFKALGGMYLHRANSVSLFTSQLQVVGKRHYGKKAVPFGGSGGRRPVRELFDSLAYWNPSIPLDAKGQATVHFKLNDSLTRFELSASVMSGLNKFGDGRASLVSSRDVQMRATLPSLVRTGDDYQASVTLRNATKALRTVSVTATADGVALAPRPVTLAPNESQEVFWQLQAPGQAGTVSWNFVARTGDVVEDEMAIKQTVVPALLPALVSADLVKLDTNWHLPLAEDPRAAPGQSEVRLSLTNSVAGGLSRVTDYFDAYPYSCAEQQTSKALGYADATRFKSLMDNLPAYVGSNSLLNYFPSEGKGSASLTAYVLNSAHAAGWAVPSDVRDRLLTGLTAFVKESRAQDASMESRLYALETLARYKALDVSWLSAQTKTLPQLGADELVSLYAIDRFAGPLKTPAFSTANIQRELLNRTGSKGVFDDRRMYWYNSDYLANLRLMELTATDPAFSDYLPKAVSQLALQFNKRKYFSTQEYAWTRLALNKAEAALGAKPLTGHTRITLDKLQKEQTWAGKVVESSSFTLPYSGTTAVDIAHAANGPAFLRYEVRQVQPLTEPQFHGVQVSRKVEAVQGSLDALKRGDVLRVTLSIKSPKELDWVAVSDPIPAGASVMDRAPLKGEKAERTGQVATLYPSYEEKGYGFYRAYFEHLWSWRSEGDGTVGTLQYYVRINTPGVYHMPETRVEAMYDPDTFARVPNKNVVVKP